MLDPAHAAHVAKLYTERYGTAVDLVAELDAGPPILAPIPSPRALRNALAAAGLPADAELCATCWRDGYRLHGSKASDRTHHFRPFRESA